MNTPRKKASVLRESLDAGVIEKEEYEREKKKIDEEIREFDNKVEAANKDIPEEEPKKSSEKMLYIGIAIVLMLFAAVIAVSMMVKQEPKTLEELHVLNLKGKLNPKQGYVYKDVYSFVNSDGLWYTQLKSPKGTKVYDMALRYAPKELANIPIEGNLDLQFFNDQTQYYVTFNPLGNDFSSVGLAVADFNTHMSKVFEKMPIAACDRNETPPCFNRPIVTCADNDKLVLYVKESERFRTYYNDNCIVVEGNGFDLVRGVDRILYNLYTIMEKEEP